MNDALVDELAAMPAEAAAARLQELLRRAAEGRAAAAQPGAGDATPSANDDDDLEVEAFEAKAAKRGATDSPASSRTASPRPDADAPASSRTASPRPDADAVAETPDAAPAAEAPAEPDATTLGIGASFKYTPDDFDRFNAWIASCGAKRAIAGDEGFVPDSLHPVFECLKDHEGVRPATVEEIREKVIGPKSRDMLRFAVFTDVPPKLRSSYKAADLSKALASLGVPYFPSAGDGGYVLDLSDHNDMEGGAGLMRELSYKGPLDSTKLQKERNKAEGSDYWKKLAAVADVKHQKALARNLDGKRAGIDGIEGTESQTEAASLEALKNMYHTFNEVRAGRSADLTNKQLKQLAAAYSSPETGKVMCRVCGCDVTLRGVGYRVHEHYKRYDEETKKWFYYMLDAACCTPCNKGVIAAVRRFGFHDLAFLESKARIRGMLEDVCESRAGNYFVA